MRLKDRWRSVRRRALSPFKRIERKIKSVAERFIVKALARSDTAAAYTSSPGTIDLMLAFLKASQRPHVATNPLLEAVSLGDGRLLVTHPTSGFMFADASNIRLIPFLVTKSYQEQATITIERELNEGDRVVHLAAGQGYHTLTIATAIGLMGRVIAVESRPAELSMLRMNVEAHALGNRVQVCDFSAEVALPLEQWLKGHQQTTVIYVSSDVDISHVWMKSLSDYFAKSSDTLLIVGSRRVTFADYSLSRLTVTRDTERRAACAEL